MSRLPRKWCAEAQPSATCLSLWQTSLERQEEGETEAERPQPGRTGHPGSSWACPPALLIAWKSTPPGLSEPPCWWHWVSPRCVPTGEWVNGSELTCMETWPAAWPTAGPVDTDSFPFMGARQGRGLARYQEAMRHQPLGEESQVIWDPAGPNRRPELMPKWNTW